MSKIEKEFNQKAKQISVQPSSSAWPDLNERMNKKKRKKTKFIQMKAEVLLVTALGVLLICLVTFMIIRIQPKSKPSSTTPALENKKSDSIPSKSKDTLEKQ